MKFTFPLTLSSLPGLGFGAALVPPSTGPVPANCCCFHLQDVTTNKFAQQDYRTGELFIDDPSLPIGWYCLNNYYRPPLLWDVRNNACILTSPGTEFQCLDPTPGRDTWSITQLMPDSIILQDYNQVSFSICDVGNRKQIFGPNPPAHMTCRTTLLKTSDHKGECKL